MARARASFWPVSCSVLLGVLADKDANHLVQTAKRFDTTGDYINAGSECMEAPYDGTAPPLMGYEEWWSNPTLSACEAHCDSEPQCTGFVFESSTNWNPFTGGMTTASHCFFYDEPLLQQSMVSGGPATCYVKNAVQASGDPHCRNVKGESFDITTTGEVNMLEVRGPSPTQRPNFRVKVMIGHINDHDACSPTVIKEVKIGGGWLAHGDDEMSVTPGRHGIPIVPESWMEFFRSQSAPPGLSVDILGKPTPSETRVNVKITVFQTVILILQRRGTKSGVDYFDLRVRNITALGSDIGGLLGNDPHDVQAAPALQCSNAKAATRLNVANTEASSTNRGMKSVAWVE